MLTEQFRKKLCVLNKSSGIVFTEMQENDDDDVDTDADVDADADDADADDNVFALVIGRSCWFGAVSVLVGVAFSVFEIMLEICFCWCIVSEL